MTLPIGPFHLDRIDANLDPSRFPSQSHSELGCMILTELNSCESFSNCLRNFGDLT